MNTHFQHFKELRQEVKKENVLKFSERTLKYFEQLQEAVEKSEYSQSRDYLKSVLNYIELNEFITDKQCEIVERILNHPRDVDEDKYYDRDYPISAEDLPF